VPKATKLLIVGKMIKTNQSILTIIRRRLQINLLLSRILTRKSLSVTIDIKKVIP
jgi:hypothetical protein